MKTINLPPTWETVVRFMLAAMRDPKLKAQTRDAFEAEIMRLARMVDASPAPRARAAKESKP